jgi:hypothetical protein
LRNLAIFFLKKQIFKIYHCQNVLYKKIGDTDMDLIWILGIEIINALFNDKKTEDDKYDNSHSLNTAVIAAVTARRKNDR